MVRIPFGFWQGENTPLVPASPTMRPPRVALALSAGAGRGWAQIGVLRALMAEGIRPDIVVGTSMGAVIGGCYCAGRLDDLTAFALSLTKRRVFGFMDFTLSGMGLLGGGRLRAMLTRDLGDLRIEDLLPRFACVATEVGTGHEVWLTQGDLVQGLCASYALPGIFEPVQVESRWLFDGALVNPIPVSVCRALGADVVIAVNLVAETMPRGELAAADMASPVPPQTGVEVANRIVGEENRPRAAVDRRGRGEQGPSMAKVLVDAFNITQDRIARSRLAGDPPDLTINVKIGRFGLFDFHRAAELIAVGHEAVKRSAADLADLFEPAARVTAKG